MDTSKLAIFPHFRPVLLAGVMLLSFGMAGPPGALAQWSIAASKAIGKLPVEGSALAYTDGVVWAGYLNLLRSRDSGLTWQPIPQFFDPRLDRILDIEFLDLNNGLVTTYFGAYVTTDGGLTWSNKLYNQVDGTSSGKFVGSPNKLAVCDFGGDAMISNDGGNNWIVQRVDTNATQILYRQGSLYLLASKVFYFASNWVGFMYKSVDDGVSWQALPGNFVADCYSFVFDS